MITDEELLMVSTIADKQVQIERHLAEAEEIIAGLKKDLETVRDKELPNAMAEVGLSSMTLTNGRKITLSTEVYASIPKDNPAAFQWLRSSGFGALIKNVISVEFGKDEDALATEAAETLASAGFSPTQKETVHPMTLKAFLKEQIGKGTDVPLKDFGAFVVTRSKVS